MNQTDRPENTGEGSASEPQKSFIIRVREEAKAITGNKKLTKLFQDLGKEAIKQVPLVGGMVTAADKLFHGLAEIEDTERQQRLKDYVIGILENYQEDVEFRTEDVLPVIRKLAADDEAAKTEYYTRLTLALGHIPLSAMPETLRYHFILLVSRLTSYQISFARELNIRQTVPVCGTVSCEAAELTLTGQDSGIVIQAVRALQNEGLMKEITYPNNREKKPAGTLYKTTADFYTLMKLLFHPGDFAPETVGLQRKAVSDIILVGSPRFIDNLYTTYLPEELKKAGLTVKIVEGNDNHLTTDWAPLYLHTGNEGHGYDEMIRLYLTQEGTSHWKPDVKNYMNCTFEKRIYLQDKSSSRKEADSCRQRMDQAVRNILAIINEMKSPA